MNPGRPHILLIDDDLPSVVDDLLLSLRSRGYRATHARTAREGLEAIYRSSPDLILLGRRLPDIDGLLFASELKNDLVLRHLPLILMDCEPLLEVELAARESGADDYLNKPVEAAELDGRIRQILRQGTVGVGCHPVTGLPGYDAVHRKVQETLEKERPFAICFLDINAFRRFNQVHGYARGDELLRATARGIAEILQSSDRYLDFLGHLGSDDFVLITGPEGIEGLCSRIVERFERCLRDFGEGQVPARDRRRGTAPAGRVFLSIAVITHEAGRPGHFARIVEQGAELLQRAKREGRSLWVKERRTLSAASPGDRAETRGANGAGGPSDGLAGHFKRFREIIQSQSVEVHFQPIVYLHSGKPFGYEALLRGPAHTYFESPVILFSLARRLDMELILDLICLRRIQRLAPRIPGAEMIFFNVSPSSFSHPMFREFCARTAKDILPERLVLEVTRKRRILEYRRFRESAEYFKQRGYSLAVDDARAGTLSLRTILALEPDYIKTDMSVTRGIHEDPAKQRVFGQFSAFCNHRRVEIIPEGVESEEEMIYLRENGARLGQGYLFSPPTPLPS